MKITNPIKVFLIALLTFVTAPSALAHPGNTDGRGGHTCRTNCPSWGYSYGEYHYHGGYLAPSYSAPSVAYTPPAPTPAPVFTFDEGWNFGTALSSYNLAKETAADYRHSAETSLYSKDLYTQWANEKEADAAQYEQSFIKTLKKGFSHVFGRAPDSKEIDFWLGRIKKGEISTTDALLEKMGFQKAKGLTMPGRTIGSVAGAKSTVATGDTIANANVPIVVARLFQEVYGRPITPSESTYWKNRARTDKKTESALRGAMSFHNSKGINH
ncbi:MAG: YHYH domain-containing protein [Candidatus Andersenbacteria bacterium]